MSLAIEENSDLSTILPVVRAAFGTDEEADLVRDLVRDKSAQPLLSLLATENGRAVGHVLFTAARLAPDSPAVLSILAPLAVVPEFQNRGIGGKLVRHGFELLTARGTDLVFVLGYPEYYPRHGFEPAGRLGYQASYPIPSVHSDAWMVHELRPGAVGAYVGKIACADALNRPEYWVE